MTVQFPIDFKVLENPFLMHSTNYIHIRENGSIISILEKEGKDLYEVWDERFMQDPQMMTYSDLFDYLRKEPFRNLISEINWN